MPITAFQPKCTNMKGVPQPHLPATISTGGAAKWVSVPPTEMFTNSRPSVRVGQSGRRLVTIELLGQQQRGDGHGGGLGDERAQHRRDDQHAEPPGGGVPLPSAAALDISNSAKRSTGRLAAMAMMITTNIGSVKPRSLPTYRTKSSHEW